MNFQQLKIFVSVVECQGFSAAARLLNLSPMAVSKQIRSLENILNVQLIERTSTRFQITEIGLLLYKHAIHILKDINNLKDIVLSFHNEPKGELRIFSSIAFGEKYIIPNLKEFLQIYPKILLNLDLSDRVPDVQREGIDVCFGLVSHWDVELIQKKLLEGTPCILAAPSYIEKYGEPYERKDLSKYKFICHSNRPEPLSINFSNGDVIDIKPSIFINNHKAFLSCAIEGLGLIYTYDFLAKDLINKGQLKRILSGEETPKVSYYSFYSPTHHIKPASRLMLDFILNKISINGTNIAYSDRNI
ncbi:LysR family transcriptional regulator [Candidatus Paracaedibacter symbiosus]|uniref:LysR family transcriptional regulator n=1 Tax=Candidatus Paracaedibacter symbiosus TaxID=244582 RepID=UPI0018DB1E8F|nr:LysR family transcriptional regulator [Candidatus Paracaedibacter symbiosus]